MGKEALTQSCIDPLFGCADERRAQFGEESGHAQGCQIPGCLSRLRGDHCPPTPVFAAGECVDQAFEGKRRQSREQASRDDEQDGRPEPPGRR